MFRSSLLYKLRQIRHFPSYLTQQVQLNSFHNCSVLMALIENFEVSPLTEKSRFITPFRINYKKNGVDRAWDGVKAHNGFVNLFLYLNRNLSVSVLVYNRDRKSLVLVKQFRPVVYYAKLRQKEGENAESVSSVPHTPVGEDGKPIYLPSSQGETLELCAGIVDKTGKTLEEIASIELHEECGYRVDPSRLRKITTVSASVGLSGTTATVFYTEVGDSDLDPNAGGGNPDEGEYIEVIYWPVSRLEELLTLTETSTPVSGLAVLAVIWFQGNILPNL